MGLLGTITSPGDIELDWTAPAGCPTQDEVRERMRTALPPGAPAPLRARMTVTGRAGAFVLEAALGTAQGDSVRRLEAATCEELAEASVLLVTLAATPEVEDDPTAPDVAVPDDVVPDVVEPDQDRSPTNITPPEDVPTKTPPPEEADDGVASEPGGRSTDPEGGAPRPTSPLSHARRVEARAGLLAGVGGLALPATTGWLAAQGGVGGRGWEVTVGAQYWIRRQVVLEGGTRGRFQLVAGQLRGCGVPAVRSIDVPLCGTVAIGVALAEGTEGLARVQSAAQLWAGLGASAAVRWWFAPHWGVVVRAESAIVPALPIFEIGGIGPVCCGRVGLMGAAGLVGRWGDNRLAPSRTITTRASPRAPSR